MEGLRPQTNLQLTGRNSNWNTFKQRILFKRPWSNRQISIFLSCSGEEAVEVYNATIKEKIERNPAVQKLLNCYDDYVKPKKN